MEEIKTERLLLRDLRMEDLADFHELMSSPAVVRYEPCGVMTLKEAEGELERRIGSGAFTAIALKDSGKVIGNVCLGKRDFNTLELGYLLNPAFWGMGYAQEGCGALIREAFLRGVHRICAMCDPENAASWRLLERLGFAREGRLKRNAYFHTDGEGRPVWKDTYLYSLLNEK